MNFKEQFTVQLNRPRRNGRKSNENVTHCSTCFSTIMLQGKGNEKDNGGHVSYSSQLYSMAVMYSKNF